MTTPTAPQCTRCNRPMPHDTALVCSWCSALLGRQLRDVVKIAGDINLTVARLDEVQRGPGLPDDLGWWKACDDYDPTRRPATNLAIRGSMDRSALAPYKTPPRLDAAERHDAAVGELTTWTRLICQERGITMPRRFAVSSKGVATRGHPLGGVALWLTSQLEWLRHHPAADEAWPALLAACAELVRLVDTKVNEGDLVGMCACGLAVYSDQTGPCKRCGEAVDLGQTRDQLIATMSARVVTASEAARWAATLGFVSDTAKLRKLIWAWADRGHIAAVDDTPRYLFGDVLRRVLDSPALLRAA